VEETARSGTDVQHGERGGKGKAGNRERYAQEKGKCRQDECGGRKDKRTQIPVG